MSDEPKKCYTSGFATEINSVESAGKIVRLGAGKTDNLMTLVGQHFCCGKADPLAGAGNKDVHFRW